MLELNIFDGKWTLVWGHIDDVLFPLNDGRWNWGPFSILCGRSLSCDQIMDDNERWTASAVT
ncbi:hypothetical protein EYZ11_006788 [Aspergillus tanneri]|uniref:Uncharacterized protein n=1 Tax=Aspergillus tanneri TaxID=1220188 RepID=A0A4S3JH24_9EURO|nr:hypothetical protein EYZ11_006788 [Aspergillus tanneri]